ncbi:hypothetical protein HK405_010185 [Cladochytrium tenue]|nr:hypothetical protein HK405_010185 [Cladochytrium tenue]
MSGESEKKIREVFEEAKEHAPCILFIDEIDAITPKRETAQREMERRIVAQLLTCMDDITPDRADFKPILVIGATNRPDSLDPALRRAGRFDREISMGVPDESARVKILEKICSKIRLSGDFDFVQLAKLTPGFVGADLQALTSEAGLVAVRRIFQSLVASQTSALSAAAETGDDSGSVEMQVDAPPVPAPAPPLARDFGAMLKADPHIVTQFLSDRSRALTGLELDGLAIRNDDFLAALGKVQPSSKREGFLTRADVTWADVGALAGVREELRMAVVEPIRHPDVFRAVGIVRPCGVLLHGPPGCGKTMLAKAVASECCCNFISVRGPELLNKYVGESERAVRLVFARAAASAPCVIFFDEIDALCPARSNDPENHSAARLVNTLLTEMDGMSPRSQVYVLAATNRPDLLDAALLRPGRLDKALYVDLPDADGRAAILAAAARSTQSPLAADVDLRAVAADTRADGCSGADLAALLRDAAVAALRRSLHVLRALGDLDDPDARMARSAAVDGGGGGDALPPVAVCAADFDAALARLVPSVSRRDRRRYELLRDKFSSDPLAPVPVPVPATADDPGVGVARPRPSSLKS